MEDRARLERLEAKLEKLEALMYEERARQREQQVEIDIIKAGRDQTREAIGRWVERIVFGLFAALGWLHDRIFGG